MSEPSPRTTLKAGLYLGSYEVLAIVGAGGMGEVYRAWDSKLKREVAIKVLPDEFCRDPERISRFQREAEILASLNHPHIATIYDIAQHAELRFLILEFVGGETLADRFARGPLPTPEALALAKQVAEGLEAAHQKGIIHRDLKPANIKVGPTGTVKVLDFGLAKTLTAEGASVDVDFSQSPTVTATGAEVVMGTPGYMSPEQARGQRVDRRTDIWSFGCVLYEALTGRSAFAGKTLPDTVAKVLEGQPVSIRQLCRDVPPDVECLVMRCLEKDADTRYPSASELLSDIAKCEKRLASRTNALITLLKRPAFAISIVAVLIAAALGMWFWTNRSDQVRRARNETIPQIEMYAEAGDWESAYALAKKAQEVISNDPALADLWPRFSWLITIPSDPSGAKVFRRAYSAGEDKWEELGTTPLEHIHLPFGYSVVRFELSGHTPLVRALGFTTEGSQQLMRLGPFKLDNNESLPPGKVRVPARRPESRAFDEGTESRDFLLGRYEVTNREYKKFIDAGGYLHREFWEHAFIKDGKEISWQNAMTLFTDKTGRPGPSPWEAGDYPEGHGEYPVSGVSWYEAAAYARFVGEELPTIHHWRFALGISLGNGSWILPASNMDADGPAPVGQFKGITWAGAYDMVGNVREWCFNLIGNKRVIAGAGWSDESAFYNPTKIESALLPLDRSVENGFRLAITHDDAEAAAKMRLPLPEATPRDVARERPVPNETFEIYRRMYAYDPVSLNPRVEATDSSRDWVRQRVSFDAAYGGERLILYLYLPRTATPPYQTLVYYPGGIAQGVDSIDQYRQIHMDFVLKSGRALAFPILKGTFERRDKAPLAGPSARRQRRIEIVNDLRRTIDYLATRKEIDSTKLGYYGYSGGGAYGPIFLALEPRLRAAVFYLAGLYFDNKQPEVDPVTFLPRVALPTLMLSGELDSGFPLETSAKPFFQLLGTPDKKHVIVPGGHFVPRPIFIRETLDWLDRYLGPVR